MAFELAGQLDVSFRSAFREADSVMEKTRQEMKYLQKQQRELEKGAAMQGGGLLSEYAKANAGQINKLAAAEQRLVSVQKISQQAAEGREKYGKAFIKTGLIAATMFGPPLAAAITFESAMADVKKVVDFDSPEQFKQMQADILKASQAVSMLPEELTAIVAAGGQAGIAREDLMGFAVTAAKMGIAFGISAEQAGDTMAKWRTAFGMTQEQVTLLADQVNYLSDKGAATAPQISAVISRIGPLGEVAGLAAKDLSALGATLVGMGIQEEVAATGLKNMMLTMNAGASATKKQRTAFAELGMNAEEVARRMQTDSKGAVLDMLNAVKKLPKEMQAATLVQLFGRESVGAIAPLLNQTDKLVENFALVEQASGSMGREFASRNATTENALKRTQAGFIAIGVTLGTVFLPQLNEAISTVSGLTAQFADWAAKNPELISTVGTLAAGAVGLTLAVTGLGYAYNVLVGGAASVLKFFIELSTKMLLAETTTTGLTTAQKAARLASLGYAKITAFLSTAWSISALKMKAAAAAQWLLNIAMRANPIGLVITSITALIGAGYLLYTHWDKVKTFFAAIWDSPLAAILAFITGPIGMLIYIASGVIANWDDVKKWFVTLWNDPGKAVDQFVILIKDKFMSVINWIGDKWTWLTNLFSNPVSIKVNGAVSSTAVGSIGRLAAGGIYNKGAFLTTFAEDSPEAAIPLDGSNRAKSLWVQAGERLGMSPGGTPSGGMAPGNMPSITWAPVIQVQGGGNSSQTAADIRGVLEEQQRNFARMMDDFWSEKSRVAY